MCGSFKFPKYPAKMMYDMALTILISIIAVVLIIITIGGNLMVSIIIELLKTYQTQSTLQDAFLFDTVLLLLNKTSIKEYYWQAWVHLSPILVPF